MREVQALLEPVFPEAQKRSQYRGAVVDGCDIEGTRYWVEVKRRKACSIADVERWTKQAEDESDGRLVMLWFRGDQQAWRVAYPLGEGMVCIERAANWHDRMAAMELLKAQAVEILTSKQSFATRVSARAEK